MWAVLGYFSVLDFGLGRATTKFVAQYAAQGDDVALRRVATLAVASQTAIGVLAGIALAGIVPLVVKMVLHVPAALGSEARSSFLLLALSLPFVVLSLSLRAILEAIQRFDLLNLIRTPRRLPARLAVALFPALSAPPGAMGDGEAKRLLAGSVRYLLLALAVPIALLVAFPGEMLQTWLGPAFAARSADVVRILSVGVLLNGLAHLPFVYLLGQGRPDVVARFHLLELLLYAVGAWWLVSGFGLTGAALAWTLRVTLDAVLLFAATRRLGGVSPRLLLSKGGGRALVAVLVLVLCGIGVGSLQDLGLNSRVALATGAAAAYGICVWRVLLADEERAGLRRSLARLGIGSRP